MINQLVKIGKFGICGDDVNTLKFKWTSKYDPSFLDLKEFYIILDRDRIRFTLAESLTAIDKELILKVSDSDLIIEAEKSKEFWLAVDSDTFSSVTAPERGEIGMQLVSNGEIIGTVIDVFNNKAHDILVAETDEGKEFMIPDVDEYVLLKDIAKGLISVQNIEGLLDL